MLTSLRPRVTFHNKPVFMVWSCQVLAQLTSWRVLLCWLSMIAYLTCSQLPSISGGRLHLQPKDASCCDYRDPRNLNISNKISDSFGLPLLYYGTTVMFST